MRDQSDKGTTFLPCQNGNVNGVSFSNDDVDENARIFLKLFVLLYADDNVILADTAEDL